MSSRRDFIVQAPLGFLGAAAACSGGGGGTPQTPATSGSSGVPSTPGAPPTFGTAPAVGPAVSPATFAEAEKLAQVTLTARASARMAAASWRTSMAPLLERRIGPRKVALDASVAPATRWNPVLAGAEDRPGARPVRAQSAGRRCPLPASDDDIAFAPVTQLSRWIETRKLTSERLTNIYLERIERFDPKLRCIITLTRDIALAQAKQADAEIAAGKYRGPLHGIPYGVKDLLDTAGIATTYGAEPFRNRVPTADSAVVRAAERGRRGARSRSSASARSRSTTSGSAARR